MNLDASITILLTLGVALVAPISLAMAFRILLRTRPKATLKEAAEAMAMVITAFRRRPDSDSG